MVNLLKTQRKPACLLLKFLEGWIKCRQNTKLNSGKRCIYNNGFSTSAAGAAVKSYFHKELEVLAGNKPKTKMLSTASDQLKKMHDISSSQHGSDVGFS